MLIDNYNRACCAEFGVQARMAIMAAARELAASGNAAGARKLIGAASDPATLALLASDPTVAATPSAKPAVEGNGDRWPVSDEAMHAAVNALAPFLTGG
jgi:hypothetical protein